MRVFLSYSRQDSEFARRLSHALEESGLETWLDIDDIPSGENWSSAIQTALDSSDTMILIISPASMASQNVNDEWMYFINSKKPLIPIMLENAEIHYRLNMLQYIDFRHQDFDTAFQRLRQALTRYDAPLPISAPSLSSVKDKSGVSDGVRPDQRNEVKPVGCYRVIEPSAFMLNWIDKNRMNAGLILLTAVLLILILNTPTQLITLQIHPALAAITGVLAASSIVIFLIRLIKPLIDTRPKAFISYQRKSSAMLANYLASTLEKEHNISVFVDTRKQDGAIDFPTRLLTAIGNNDVFVCLISEETLMESSWVRKEISEAQTRNKPMIPVFQERYKEWSKTNNITTEELKKMFTELQIHEDWDSVYSLLQSEGVDIYDISNRFVDPAIKELADMIKWTVEGKKR